MKENKQANTTEMLVRGTVTNLVAISAAKYLADLKPELCNQVLTVVHRQKPGFIEWLLGFKRDNFFAGQTIDIVTLVSYDHKTKLLSLKLTFNDADQRSYRPNTGNANPDDLKDAICLSDDLDWRYFNDVWFNDITNGSVTQAGIDEYRKFASSLEKNHQLRTVINDDDKRALDVMEQIIAHKDTHTPTILWVSRPIVGGHSPSGRRELHLFPNKLYKKLMKRINSKAAKENFGNICF